MKSASSRPASSKGTSPRTGEARPTAWWVPVAVATATYLPAVGILAFALGHLEIPYGFFDASDIPLYHSWANAIGRGMRPYADFRFEYPPGALWLVAFPGHPVVPGAYGLAFAGLMLALLGAAAICVVYSLNGARADVRTVSVAAATYGLAVVATGAIVANRLDAALALVFASVLWALASSRWLAAGALLGLGTAMKLTPAVLLPLALLLPPGRRGRGRVAVAFAIALLIPFLLEGRLAGQALLSVLGYHGERPLQVESVLATPLLLAGVAKWIPLRILDTHGSQGLAAPAAMALARLSGPLVVAAVAGVTLLAWRRRGALAGHPGRIALAALATMLALLATSKVLSPQYLVWFIPMVALVATEHRGLAGLLLLTMLATQVEFPLLYWQVIDLEPAAVLILAARNVAVVAALVWSVVLLVRLPSGPPGLAGARASQG